MLVFPCEIKDALGALGSEKRLSIIEMLQESDEAAYIRQLEYRPLRVSGHRPVLLLRQEPDEHLVSGGGESSKFLVSDTCGAVGERDD